MLALRAGWGRGHAGALTHNVICSHEMKLTNFRISGDFIAIEVGDSYYDLHNNFDFVGLIYDVQNKEISLNWEKSEGYWVRIEEPKSLRLLFSKVYLFKCKERDPALPVSEDNCLNSMGFIDNTMLGELEGFSHPEPRERAAHLNLSFMSGFAMKIGAATARCEVVWGLDL
jgi:hypothetical protein